MTVAILYGTIFYFTSVQNVVFSLNGISFHQSHSISWYEVMKMAVALQQGTVSITQERGKVKIGLKISYQGKLYTKWGFKAQCVKRTHQLQHNRRELWDTRCRQHVCHQETWLP